MLVIVTVQCSVLLKVTVTAVFSAPYGRSYSAVFSAPYGQSLCSVQCSFCHSLCSVQCSLLSLTAPYLRSAVVMNEPGPRTASRENDAVASHSFHFNIVLHPTSYSECLLPLKHSRHDIRCTAFPVENYRKIIAVTALSSLARLQTCQQLYNAM